MGQAYEDRKKKRTEQQLQMVPVCLLCDAILLVEHQININDCGQTEAKEKKGPENYVDDSVLFDTLLII